MEKPPKILLYIFTGCFFLILILPVVNDLFGVISETEKSENRVKVEKPIFDIYDLDNYTESYDKYFTDNFSLRSNLIEILHRIEFNLFNVSPAPRVVTVGEDGWFFARKSTQNATGENRFQPFHLDSIRREIQNRTRWCKKRGIEYYIVVVPNKMTMYPEFWPYTIIKKNRENRYDQVCELDRCEDVNVINLKSELLKHKGAQALYYKTDDHWTDYGAYYGYRAIMERIKQGRRQLEPIQEKDLIQEQDRRIGNMARIISMGERYEEEITNLTVSNSKGKNGKETGYNAIEGVAQGEYEMVKKNDDVDELTCLIIRDSFSLKLIKFLQEHFSRTVFIHDGWKYRMREDIIESEKPDIVINVILETYVHELLKHPFVLTD